MRVAVISCTKLKEDSSCVAANMYKPSQLFKKASQYAGENYLYWFVLSAKYGLLTPNQWIEPYDLTLNNMKSNEVKEWSQNVFNELATVKVTEVDFYAGRNYRKYLIPLLEEKGIKCNVPLEGLGIGQQLAWYKNKLTEELK